VLGYIRFVTIHLTTTSSALVLPGLPAALCRAAVTTNMINTVVSLPTFTKLSHNVWYSLPTEKVHLDDEKAQNAPNLILLATWMGAPIRPTAKYTAGYRTLYPNTPILLVQNDVKDIGLRSYAYLNNQLRPALQIIEQVEQTPASRILVHLMSNGGAIMVRQLAQMYRARHHRPLPIKSMVLDSSPGIEGFRTGVTAMSASLPKTTFVRLIVTIFMAGGYLWWKIGRALFGFLPFLTKMRHHLNDPTLFPKEAPRLYIYSKLDELVDSNDVEAHAIEAAQLGWTVKQEFYRDSKHVAHLMADSKRYWASVHDLVSNS